MISLSRHREKFTHASSKLSQVGINPTMFEGTDGKDDKVPQAQLDSACSNNCAVGPDSHPRSFQGLIDSHRRALEAAQKRDSEWTAIFEDDAVPYLEPGVDTPASWMSAFDAVWQLLPPQAEFVRLGRCFAKPWWAGGEVFKTTTYADGGHFTVTQWTGINGQYDVGGCTHAYVVKKSFIPKMLSVFPCNCAWDCCLKGKLFSKEDKQGPLFNIETKMPPQKLVKEAADMWGTDSSFYSSIIQFGVLKQDWSAFPNGVTRDASRYTPQSLTIWNSMDLFGAPPAEVNGTRILTTFSD
jgi:hypothetical protein